MGSRTSRRPRVTARKDEPSPRKAQEILRDGKVHGRPLSPKQLRFFHAIANGQRPRRTSTPSSSRSRARKGR